MISERLWEYITILAVVLECPALEPRKKGLGHTRGVGQERDPMGAARSQGTAGGMERTDGEIPCGQGDVLDGRTALTCFDYPDSRWFKHGSLLLKFFSMMKPQLTASFQKFGMGWNHQVHLLMKTTCIISFDSMQTRMRGNFDYTLRRWREDGCWRRSCKI